MNLRQVGIALVILHVLVVTPHSIAHTALHIDMNYWQNVYIVLVILIGPIVAAGLLWKRPKVGFVLLALTMAGSFFFGGYYHFIAEGADNIASLQAHAWSTTFQVSAVLLGITEFVGTVIGITGWSKS